MPRPPITKKPIPRNLKHWGHEVTGMWKFLHKLHNYKATYGLDWVEKMRHHAKCRLADLVDNKPPGGVVPAKVDAWRRRINL